MEEGRRHAVGKVRLSSVSVGTLLEGEEIFVGFQNGGCLDVTQSERGAEGMDGGEEGVDMLHHKGGHLKGEGVVERIGRVSHAGAPVVLDTNVVTHALLRNWSEERDAPRVG